MFPGEEVRQLLMNRAACSMMTKRLRRATTSIGYCTNLAVLRAQSRPDEGNVRKWPSWKSS